MEGDGPVWPWMVCNQTGRILMISQQPAMVDYRVCLNVDACCFYKNSANSTFLAVENGPFVIYHIYIYSKSGDFHLKKNLFVSPDGRLLKKVPCAILRLPPWPVQVMPAGPSKPHRDAGAPGCVRF